MPDMSPADIAGIAGAFLAAIISGLGLKRGEAEKRGLPAPDPSLAAGVFVGLEAETQRAILDALRELHADLANWRGQDEAERRADKERSTAERFEQIENDQAKMLALLHRIDGAAAEGAQAGR